MGKILLIMAVTYATFLNSALAERSYVEGDGSLDFYCEDVNSNAQPWNAFQFTLLYDENSPRNGLDIISDENLASGNGDIVYRIEALQAASITAEIPLVPQTIPGCEDAPVRITQDDSGNYDASFECNGDGDAGYGNLSLNLQSFNLGGVINFPEGQPTLLYPLAEDTKIELNCRFKDM